MVTAAELGTRSMGKIADNPYPGSRAFQQADYQHFFGRSADVNVVIDLWTANRLTFLAGPPGCGKTSLLRAGVYPLMPVKPSRLLPAGDLMRGMTFPFPALADHNPFTLALLRSWSPEEVPTRLAGLTVSDFVGRYVQRQDDAVYAAIDQLDDFVAGPRDGSEATGKQQQQFLAGLTQAIADHPRLHLLLVVRGEALGRLTRAVGGGARHSISGLTEQDALDALVRPAALAGRTFSEEAAYHLLDDLRVQGTAAGGDGQAPAGDRVEPSLLQTVGRQLWENLPPGTTEISDLAVREFGEADAALATRCGQVIAEVAALHDMTVNRLRSWLVANFVDSGGVRLVVSEDRRTTAGLPNAVPRGLLERHLLTSEVDESARYYRLLTQRLVEPLGQASADRRTAPTAAECLLAAERDLALGELDFARTHGERARRGATSFSEHAQAESLLGNVEHRRGNPGAALPHYQRAAELLQAAGDTSAAVHLLAAQAQVLLAEGQPADALPELRAAVERTPNDPWLHTQLALALWQLGDGPAAVAILNWVLTFDGGQVEARRARGEILADLGDARGALLDLERADLSRPSSRAARGLALAGLGDHAGAAAEINGAVADARRSGLVLLYAARVFDLAGDKASAGELAREASDATDPPLSAAHHRLARQLAGRRPRLPPLPARRPVGPFTEADGHGEHAVPA